MGGAGIVHCELSIVHSHRLPEHRPNPLVGQHLDQDRVGHAPIDDEHALDAPPDRVDAALHFRDHAATDHAVAHQRGRLGDLHLADQRAWVVPVAQQPHDVGHGDHALRAQLARDARRGGVGVDVVGVAELVVAHGGDHRDVAFFQHVQDDPIVDVRDLAHVPQLGFERCRPDHAAVHAR